MADGAKRAAEDLPSKLNWPTSARAETLELLLPERSRAGCRRRVHRWDRCLEVEPCEESDKIVPDKEGSPLGRVALVHGRSTPSTLDALLSRSVRQSARAEAGRRSLER